jgi:hypothetical protein
MPSALEIIGSVCSGYEGVAARTERREPEKTGEEGKRRKISFDLFFFAASCSKIKKLSRENQLKSD